MLEGEQEREFVWDAEAAGDLVESQERKRNFMSIAGYFGSGAEDLVLKAGDVLEGVAEISNGGLPVASRSRAEEAQARAALKGMRRGERYDSVRDYDPVLRAHCRLDREG